MSWEEFRRKARIIEENFAKNLTDVVKATKNQDMYEHWDMVGKLDNKVFKFEVKGQKNLIEKI